MSGAPACPGASGVSSGLGVRGLPRGVCQASSGRLRTGSFGLEQDAVPKPLPFVIGMASEDRNGLGEAAPRLRALQPLPETSVLGSSVLSKVLASAVALGHILGRAGGGA